MRDKNTLLNSLERLSIRIERHRIGKEINFLRKTAKRMRNEASRLDTLATHMESNFSKLIKIVA